MIIVAIPVLLVSASIYGVRLAFRPRHLFGPPDHRVERLERARLIGGTVVTIVSIFPYSGFAGVFEWITDSVVLVPVINAVAVVPAILIAWVILVLVNPPRRWLRAAWAMRRPILTMLLAAAAWSAWGGIVVGLSLAVGHADAHDGSVSTSVLFVATAMVSLALTLLIPALVTSLYLGARHWYNAVDGHPLLPATSSLVFLLGLLLVHLAGFFSFGGVDPQFPLPVAALLSFGGIPVAAGIAVTEIALLRRTGVTFRQPLRVRTAEMP